MSAHHSTQLKKELREKGYLFVQFVGAHFIHFFVYTVS